MNAQEIREDRAAYQQLRREGWRLYPVARWAGFTYVVLGRLRLVERSQRLPALDVSSAPDIARFSAVWPEVGDAWTRSRSRDQALVRRLPEDLRAYAVWTEDGGERTFVEVDLRVRVMPADPAALGPQAGA
jgi:hypothetical protein